MTIKIWSFGFSYPTREWPKGVDVYDAQDLPDPHSDITLRHLNGLDKKVQQFMLDIDGIDDWFDMICKKLPKVGIAIGCFGGVHRSVSLAEELGRRLGVKPEHLDLAKRAPWKNIPEWEYAKKKKAREAWSREQGFEVASSWTSRPASGVTTTIVRPKSKKTATDRAEELQELRDTQPAGHRVDEYCPWCGQRSPGRRLHATCKLEMKRQPAKTARKQK